MELPGGDDEWLAPSPSPPGPAVPDRHDEHGVGTFIWPPVGTSTWPPVGTFSWPRTSASASGGGTSPTCRTVVPITNSLRLMGSDHLIVAATPLAVISCSNNAGTPKMCRRTQGKIGRASCRERV